MPRDLQSKAVNQASNIQRKQPQLLKEFGGVQSVAEWLKSATVSVAVNGFIPALRIAAGLLGPGWNSIGQAAAMAMGSRRKDFLNNDQGYDHAADMEIAKYNSLYAPAPAGFAAFLTAVKERVRTDIGEVLRRDFTPAATAAWDAASQRTVS